MLKSNLKTAFPWYKSRELQSVNLPECKGGISFSLYSYNTRLLPFVIKTEKKVTALNSLIIYKYGDFSTNYNITTALLNPAIFQTWDIQNDNSSYIQYIDKGVLFNLPCGYYEAVLNYNNTSFLYSEVFYVPPAFNENDYMKISYSNSCDKLGILYQKGLVQEIFLDANLSKNQPEIEEEGETDGEKRFYPTFQRYIENLRIDDIVPEFMVDAFTTLQMHDNVTFRRRNSVEEGLINNIKTAIVWESGCMATVEIKFQQDRPDLSSGSCCGNVTLSSPSNTGCNISILGLQAEVTGSMALISFVKFGPQALKFLWREATTNAGQYNTVLTTAFSQNFSVGTHTVFIRAVCLDGKQGTEAQVTFVIS